MRFARVATCNLNQWAMDFLGNRDRIAASIRQAKAAGCTYRIGPELEVSGYSCEDHFLEPDTFMHSWEVLVDLLPLTDGILCDIGMPVMFGGVRYNCRVLCVNKRIVLICPKKNLAMDGNYREARFFTAWPHTRQLFDFPLPKSVQEATGQAATKFGDGVVSVHDVLVGTETCEELFTPNSPHIHMALAGVHIIGNGSGSHHQLRKLDKRLMLLKDATAKGGGVYLYSNQQGCDGNRLYFDGCAMVCVNGQIVAQGTQFSLRDVEVVTAVVDVDAVIAYRAASPSRSIQAAAAPLYPTIVVDDGFDLLMSDHHALRALPSPGVDVHLHTPAEEIALGPACWLWDYLRRSGMSGFFLPLSGGADSSSTAAIVGCMCQLIVKACNEDGLAYETVLKDVRRVVGEKEQSSAPSVEAFNDLGERCTVGGGYVPSDARELAGRLFFTSYMGTVNSSEETRARAAKLSEEIGAHHVPVKIDPVVGSIKQFIVDNVGKTPRFQSEGGSAAEDLALQNIQARSRMVLSYVFAQLLLWSQDRGGSLLVLGSANVDEALRGYLTKYDCSSADVNPIGGISKADLKMFLEWGAVHLGFPSLADVRAAKPTAELRPGADKQIDEEDMGMSYDELREYGRLRKIEACGPVSMFHRLLSIWRDRNLSATDISNKVQFFFRYYSINRHKLTVLTPSYHAENYSPDDNRFDLRQFLYNVRWPWQFQRMDQRAREIDAKRKADEGDANERPAKVVRRQ